MKNVLPLIWSKLLGRESLDLGAVAPPISIPSSIKKTRWGQRKPNGLSVHSLIRAVNQGWKPPEPSEEEVRRHK